MAEVHVDGVSRRLRDALRIGNTYTIFDIAPLIGVNPVALRQTGVFRKSGSDAFVILVTLNKRSDATQYADALNEESSLLFWEGQTSMRTAEDSFRKGLDCYAFVRDRSGIPYDFYGRAVVLRSHINEPGTPSEFVLYLPEYDEYRTRLHRNAETLSESISFSGPTERENVQRIRTAQKKYRDLVIDLWHGQCAVTGVDETSWLIASHIKPWRESSAAERIDPRNSLLLSPNYDKLFDRGVISFSPENGKIILPAQASFRFWKNMDRLGINDEKTLSYVPEGTGKYLDYHRHRVFGYSPSSEFDLDSFVSELPVNSYIN